MDHLELEQRIERYESLLDDNQRADLAQRLAELSHAYPFTAWDYRLMYLQHAGVLSFDSYEDLRAIYVAANPNLYLFEMDPRQFGGQWGVNHLLALHPELAKPIIASDANGEGAQPDMHLEAIRIGVRAARVVRTETRGSMASKAMRFGTDRAFFLNFQQLNLDACDAFVFIGVWVDAIVYWILSRDEARNNKYLTHMHRAGIAYQIGLKNTNLDEFNANLTPQREIPQRLRAVVASQE